MNIVHHALTPLWVLLGNDGLLGYGLPKRLSVPTEMP